MADPFLLTGSPGAKKLRTQDNSKNLARLSLFCRSPEPTPVATRKNTSRRQGSKVSQAKNKSKLNPMLAQQTTINREKYGGVLLLA